MASCMILEKITYILRNKKSLRKCGNPLLHSSEVQVPNIRQIYYFLLYIIYNHSRDRNGAGSTKQ